MLFAGSSFESTRISRGTIPSQTSLRNSVVDAGDDVKFDGEWRMPPKVDIVWVDKSSRKRLMAALCASQRAKIPLTITSVPRGGVLPSVRVQTTTILVLYPSLFFCLSFLSHSFFFFLTVLCHARNIDNIDHDEHSFSASSLGLQGSTFMCSFVAWISKSL